MSGYTSGGKICIPYFHEMNDGTPYPLLHPIADSTPRPVAVDGVKDW